MYIIILYSVFGFEQKKKQQQQVKQGVYVWQHTFGWPENEIYTFFSTAASQTSIVRFLFLELYLVDLVAGYTMKRGYIM